MSATTKPQAAGPHVASPLPAVPPPAARERGDLARKALACLASGPKSRTEIREIVGCDPWAVHKALGKLLRAGAAVQVGKARYGATPEAQAKLDETLPVSAAPSWRSWPPPGASARSPGTPVHRMAPCGAGWMR